MKAKQATANAYEAVNTVAQAMIAGRLDVRGDTSSLSGHDAELVNLVNRMVDSLIAPIRLASGALDEIAHGRIPPFVVDDQEGEYDRIKRSINTLLAVLYGMHRETLNLTDSVREGRLRTRGNDWDYEGIWKELLSGMNRTLDAVVDPVHEASAVLGRLASYDLNARMHGRYRGDHAVIRDAMNATAATLHGAISQVTETVGLATGVGRSLMESSATVADGAQEQSRRVEDATGDLERLAESSRRSADNTEKTRTNARAAAESVTTAKASMERMLEAMSEINKSAESTAAVIGEIDAIAKETGGLSAGASVKAANMRTSAGGFGVVAQEIRKLSGRCAASATKMKALEKRLRGSADTALLEEILALSSDMQEVSMFAKLLGVNASIEAAHVEGAGQDFNVLTDEIQGLATRSADAARRTEALIESSVVQSRSGVSLFREIDRHLADAAEGASAISQLAGELTEATTEQAGSIAHINDSVSQIHVVTQKNSSSAAESLGAAGELNGQMERLSSMVRKFKV
jgi:methyl-accepting chemotaxis protein